MATSWQSEIMAAIELTVLDAGAKLVLPTLSDAADFPNQGIAYIAAEFATVLSFAFDFGQENCYFRFYPMGRSPGVAIGFVHEDAIREFKAMYYGDGSAIREMLTFIKEYTNKPKEQAG